MVVPRSDDELYGEEDAAHRVFVAAPDDDTAAFSSTELRAPPPRDGQGSFAAGLARRLTLGRYQARLKPRYGSRRWRSILSSQPTRALQVSWPTRAL